MDGQDGPPMEVTTGLPQGSPVLPVLFCIYLSGVHGAVEERVQGARGISFVDDVTWFVEGGCIEEVAAGLERCAQESIRWARSNVVRSKASKTEAILLSRKKGLGQQIGSRAIQVGDRRVSFAREATRWLEVWLDSALVGE